MLGGSLARSFPASCFSTRGRDIATTRFPTTVAALEKQQQELLEANRDAIAQIAYEQFTGSRGGEGGGKSFTLAPADQAHVTRVV